MSDNLLVRDAAGASKTVRTTERNGLHVPHHIESPFRSSAAITPDTDGTPGEAIIIDCTVAGDVSLKLADDSTVVWRDIQVGTNVLAFSVKTVNVSGTTATATYKNLFA